MNNDLVEGDSAQFAAGILYAGSGQFIDERDYLVGCSKQRDGLDNKLEGAYEAYSTGDMKLGNRKMKRAILKYRYSMQECTDT